MKTILNYADLVKEQHALNTTIAPVETDLTSASQAYAVGQKFIYDGVLYQAKTAIAQGAALVLNTNYEAADDVSSELEALTNKLNNEIVTRSELGAKNLLPYDIQKIKALNTAGTWNGNTYTPNNSSLNITLNTDGSITVDGTSASAATATLYIYGSASEANENIFKGMIASGCPSGGATNKYSLAIQGFSTTTPSGGNNYHDIGEGITVGNDNYVRVYVRIQNNTTVSNLTFKPMIRLASDPDATYQPYAKTNQELTAENQTLTNELSDEVETRASLGAHNLLPNQVSTTTGDMTGITKNEDGTVTIEPRTGLSEGGLYFSVRGTKDFFLPNGRYIISGGLNNDIYISGGYTNTSGEYQSFGVDYGSGLSIIINGCNLRDDGAYITFWVGVRGDISSQLTIYPMIRLASDPSTEFTPYAMTNRELTDKVTQMYVKNESYTYTVPSNTTWKQALHDFYIAANSYFYNLPAEDFIEVINFDGTNLPEFYPRYLVMGGHTLTDGQYIGWLEEHSATNDYSHTYYATISADVSKCMYRRFRLRNDGNMLFTDDTDTAVAANSTITVRYRRFYSMRRE